MPNEIYTRAILDNIEVRSINKETRSATFVATTENPVMTWFGPEVLRMSGADLERYRKNPVVLDTHNRWEIASVIGRATVKVEKRELIADVTFAATERAQTAWELVEGGFVKAMSVGYQVMQRLELEDGEKDGDVEGPAVIAKKWQLFELSIVPVPADEDALKRELRNWLDGNNDKGESMGSTTEVKTSKNVKEEEVKEKPEAQEKKEEPKVEERKESVRKRAIEEITPDGLRDLSDKCVVEGKTVEETRAIFLEELAKRSKPVGTPEPPAKEPKTPEKKKAEEAEKSIKEISGESFVRGLGG